MLKIMSAIEEKTKITEYLLTPFELPRNNLPVNLDNKKATINFFAQHA